MRVGGVHLEVVFVHRVLVVTILAFVALSLAVSVSAAVLLVTSFCFGATLLSIALDLSQGHQLPNFISSWVAPSLHDGFRCGQCKKQNCLAHLDFEPYSNLSVPVEVDSALGEFFERLLEEYVYFWYREISYDEDFMQEIRYVLRHSVAILTKRLLKVDLTDLIVKRVIPIGLSHIDALIHADNFVRSPLNTREINLELREAYMDFVGPRLHPAALSRVKEVDYVHEISSSLVPLLLPPRYRSSKTMNDLIKDLLFGAVLQPVLDLVGNPDMTANPILALAFHPGPSRKFPPASGAKVELLGKFAKTHGNSQNSALRIDMSTILKNETSLFAFMNFLKEKQAIDQLHFCLAVEEFNKKIMSPELSEDDMKNLHDDAMSLYNLHFKSNAEHKVNVSPSLVAEIHLILSGPMSNVVQLRSTPPLFKAYEEVYSSLESKYCPSFFKSEEYFTYLLGKRDLGASEGTDKNASKSKDMNVKAGIGKGLSKLKQGVLGKSMEGIIDAPTDPAFDIADMCTEDIMDGDEGDETLTSIKPGLGSILEYKDLSAWRVQIPRVATKQDENGKKFFIFVVEVQRIDITSTMENAEDLQWTVFRKYSEFYTLESKLTEFHGQFEDLHLPPKVNLFVTKDLDVLQSKMKPFEEFLGGLLRKPFLKESDILFTFLTSSEEFTLANSTTFGVGKIINKVNPIKLTSKERGQSLQLFIDNFVASTLSPPSKPRYDSVIGSYDEHDDHSARVIEPHKVFANIFNLVKYPRQGPVFASVETHKIRQETGVFNVIFYLAATLFKVSPFLLQLLHGVGIVVRKSFDHLVDYGIRSKLAAVLCPNRVAYLVKLVEASLFDSSRLNVTEEQADIEKRLKKEQALDNFRNFLRPFVQPLAGQAQYEDGIQFVFDSLQDPILSKQLTYILLDVVLEELFPELAKRSNH